MIPATRADLAEVKTELKGDIAALAMTVGALEQRVGALEQRVGALEQRVAALEQKVAAMEQTLAALEKTVAGLPAEFARMAQAMMEEFRGMFGILDDKYRDVPVKLTTLRGDHDAHVANSNVHRAPRRTKRAKPRR